MNLIEYNQFKKIYNKLNECSEGKIEYRKIFDKGLNDLKRILDKESVKLGIKFK